MWTPTLRVLLVAMMLVWGCGRDDGDAASGRSSANLNGRDAPPTEKPPAAEPPAAETPAAEPPTEALPTEEPPAAELPAAAPATVTATVGRLNVGPEAPMETVDVTFTLPIGWGEETAWGKGHWGPAGGDLAFSFRATCSGNCHPAAIPGNLAGAFKGLQKSAAQPNLNTGDPAKDAIRATVETLLDEELPGGRIMALKVTYTEEIMATGPYTPQLRFLAVWHKPGDAWYLSMNMRTTLKEGEAVLPALVEVSKSVEVKGPTPNDAEQQEAVKVETCALSALPEGAYTVESKNSKEQPSVILLTRPVVIGDLKLAPIGRVYVEYNDDPISLRDVFTVEDQAFEVGGVQVVCLRRQPLRIDGACTLRRCILAGDTDFEGFSLPAFSEVNFETGPGGEAWVKRVQVPAGGVFKAEEAAHQGPGRAIFSDGAFQEWKPQG